MTHLNSLLLELERTDRALTSVPFGDFTAFAAILDTRGTLLHNASQAIDTLKEAAPEYRIALVRSQEAASQALRQLILARHMLATEFSHLKQDQRLGDALRSQSDTPAPRVSLQG